MKLCPICNQVLRTTLVDGVARHYCPHCRRHVYGLTNGGRMIMAAWGGWLVIASAWIMSLCTEIVPISAAFALGVIGAGMIALAVRGE